MPKPAENGRKNGGLHGSAVFFEGLSSKKTPQKISSDANVLPAHGSGWPRDAELGGRPDSPERSAIGESGEADSLYAVWDRRMADLNKEFFDNLRRNGTVIVGRQRTKTFC